MGKITKMVMRMGLISLIQPRFKETLKLENYRFLENPSLMLNMEQDKEVKGVRGSSWRG